MATAATAQDKKGMKRICTSCSTRFYDFNKRPVICPNCKAEFTGEIKVKSRRGRAAAIDSDEGQVSSRTAAGKAAPGDDEEEDALLEGDDGVVSLDELDEDEDDEELESDEADMDLDEDDVDDDILEDDDLDDEDDEDEDDEDDDEDEDEDDDEDDDTPKRKKKR